MPKSFLIKSKVDEVQMEKIADSPSAFKVVLPKLKGKFYISKKIFFSRRKYYCGHTTTAIWGSSPTPVI